MDFEPADELARLADTFAAQFVERAADAGITLDYSVESVDLVEAIADRKHAERPLFMRFRRGAAEDYKQDTTQMGFYLAEVIRRAWGGDHGWAVRADGEPLVTLRLADGGLCWPIGRAQARLTNGRDHDLVFYVTGLGATLGHGVPRATFRG